MKILFSIKDTEGNELKVSLCSFSPEVASDFSSVLGTTELVDITLERNGEGYVKSSTLASMVETIGGFLADNQDTILYYYCDEINVIPRMRRTQSLSPSEYRNKLFSLLFKKGKNKHEDLPIVDREIAIETEEGQSFIHLIYYDHLEEKAAAIEQELHRISEELK